MNPAREGVAQRTKGWLLPGEGAALADLARGCTGPYLEVGTYCGKSTVWIGDVAQANDTVLFTVDHHRGSPEMSPGHDCYDPAVVDRDGRHDTLPYLRRTLADAQLEDHVVPVVGSSVTVGRYWTTPVGFAFIDAAHDAEGVAHDARAWGRHVRPGGLVAFHDTTISHIGAAFDSLLADFDEIPAFGCLRVGRRR